MEVELKLNSDTTYYKVEWGNIIRYRYVCDSIDGRYMYFLNLQSQNPERFTQRDYESLIVSKKLAVQKAIKYFKRKVKVLESLL